MTFRLLMVAIATTWGFSALASKPIHLQSETLQPSQALELELSHSNKEAKNFIVQFSTGITEGVKQELKSKGFKVISYVPEDALLVRSLTKSTFSDLKNLKNVTAVYVLQPQWKISSAAPVASIFNADQPVSLMIKTFEAMDISNVIRGEVLQSDEDYHHVTVLAREIPELLENQNVQWIDALPEIESMVLPLDPAATISLNEYEDTTGYETGTLVMKFPAAWERSLTGAGQAVAMADTGLDRGVIGTLGEDFSTVKRGYKFGLFAEDWSDPMGHGTHVAGSVMSQGVASEGRFRGGAYNAEMIPQGMWSPTFKNMTVPPKLAKMLLPAYNDGARVHTNSWGSPKDLGKYHSYSAQVDKFMWEHPEMLIVFAAGNSGEDNDHDGRIDPGSMSFPGTAKNILTVGASENYLLSGGIQRKLGELKGGKPWGTEPIASDTLSNNENGIAAFSSRGPTNDGRLKPDVVAPGTNIVSNCSPIEGASPLWGNYNETYCYSGGTSMSAPLVAGGAAVTRQFLIEQMNIPQPSGALVKAVMMNSATDLFPGQFGEVGKSLGQELLHAGPNNDQGFGRVNMDAATQADRLLKVVDQTEGVAAGSSMQFQVTVPQAGSFKATLVYTDAPGSENAAKALVNDLDLKVTVAEQEYLSDSRTDNIEYVQLSRTSGIVTFEVIGHNIPMGKNGKQPFAVVISQ